MQAVLNRYMYSCVMEGSNDMVPLPEVVVTDNPCHLHMHVEQTNSNM